MKSRVEKRRKSNKQYIWEYMRRNRIVKVEDILTIFDLKRDSLRIFFNQLERAGYIKVRKINGKTPFRFEDRAYVLVKNSGILVPRYVKKKRALWDPNLREFNPKIPLKVDKEWSFKELQYAKSRVVKILLDCRDCAFEYIQKHSGVRGKKLSLALEELETEQIVEQRDGRFFLVADMSAIYESVNLERRCDECSIT